VTELYHTALYKDQSTRKKISAKIYGDFRAANLTSSNKTMINIMWDPIKETSWYIYNVAMIRACIK